MQATPAPRLLPHLWKSALVSGVLSLALGVLTLTWPGKTILVAGVLFGVYLLVSGAAQVVLALSLPVLSAGERALSFISGAASLVLAVLCFRHFDYGYPVLLLAIWIGIGWIFRGVATTVAAISDPTLPGRGWTIFMGAMTLLAGMVMLASPVYSIEVLALVVGCWLVAIGIAEIVSSFTIRRATNNVVAALSGR